jgi:WD40 repeat protein
MVSEPAYSRDGKRLAVAVGSWGGEWTIKVLDAESGEELHALAGHRFPVWKLAFSPDGRRLASSSAQPPHPTEVKLWDVPDGRELVTFQTTESGTIQNNSLVFSPDGHRLFYIPGGARRDAEVQVWDATPLTDERPNGSK